MKPRFIWVAAGIEFRVPEFVIACSGLEVRLSPQGWRVLDVLIRSAPGVVSIDDIIAAIYVDAEEPDQVCSLVYNLIHALRLALRKIRAPIRIKNLFRCGWGIVPA